MAYVHSKTDCSKVGEVRSRSYKSETSCTGNGDCEERASDDA
jgi:hypothetical protein